MPRPCSHRAGLGWELLAFNERFRFYRYDVGQTFNRHFDGAFSRGDDEQSQFTFLIYLNDDFAGGQTNFFDDNGAITHSIQSRRGTALVFWHPMMHEGATVIKGRKYVLRTGVMYCYEYKKSRLFIRRNDDLSRLKLK